MRISTIAGTIALLVVFSLPARADYIVLRSGQRLMVTGYRIDGDTYRLQLQGGTAEIPAKDVLRVDPQDVFEPVTASAASEAPFGQYIHAAASHYGVDAELIRSVIAVESGFEPRAVSRRNARGLMQLLPETAARFGVRDVFDPRQNIEAGTRYLSELLRKYDNNLVLALAAYNAGPQRVQRYGQRVPPFTETVSYVKRVRELYRSRKSASAGPGAANRPPAPIADRSHSQRESLRKNRPGNAIVAEE